MEDRFICMDCEQLGKKIPAQVFYGALDLCRDCAKLREAGKRKDESRVNVEVRKRFYRTSYVRTNSTKALRWPSILDRLNFVSIGETTDIYPDNNDARSFAKSMRCALQFTRNLKLFRWSIKVLTNRVSVTKVGTWEEKDRQSFI